jgi:ATP-binding cassette subfamily B multidrug efflux pump
MFGPFRHYIRPYLRHILFGLAAIAVAQAAAARIPLLLGDAVNSIDPTAPASQTLDVVYLMVAQILALAVVVAAGNYIMRRLLGFTSTHIEFDIRTAYFVHLMKLPLAYYQTHKTGDLMARATNDLSSVKIFFMYGVRGLAEITLTLAFTITLMCLIDLRLSVIVLVPLVLLSLFMVRMAGLVHARFGAIQRFFGLMSNFIQENLAGIRVVKAYVQGTAQTTAFEKLNASYLEKNNLLVQTHAVYRPFTHLVASIGLGLNLWFGGHALVAGSISMGDFVALNAYLTVLIRPIAYVGWVLDRVQRALVAMRRINDVLNTEPPAEKQTFTARGRSLAGEIRFRDLSFNYGDHQVLRSIDLDIPAGSTLGICGRVGAGKTTLVRLIPRLIRSQPGQLLLDGLPIEDWPPEQIRAGIGYVSQTPFLFSNSLSANLAYGQPDASQERIVDAAAQAELSTDVAEFDDGFATLIGERGVTLSGGQKQRATLGRALLLEPRILILDDALSAVDTRTENAILEHMSAFLAQRTAIIVAHRVSTLRLADQIVVLDDGEIAERGDHRELVGAGGFYAELVRRQALSSELEAM